MPKFLLSIVRCKPIRPDERWRHAFGYRPEFNFLHFFGTPNGQLAAPRRACHQPLITFSNLARSDLDPNLAASRSTLAGELENTNGEGDEPRGPSLGTILSISTANFAKTKSSARARLARSRKDLFPRVTKDYLEERFDREIMTRMAALGCSVRRFHRYGRPLGHVAYGLAAARSSAPIAAIAR